ncbi:MAG: sigma 54-interacting transcriptional regulator [Acidobacteriota bacterium]
MLRLVAYAPNGVQRFPLASGELVIGSATECDICLPFSGIAKRHAVIRRSESGAEIEDLGTRRPTLLNGERVRTASLKVLDEVRVGKVTLLLEDVLPPTEAPPESVRARKTGGPPNSDRLLEHIARVSDWVTLDTESRRTIESLLVDLLNDLGGGGCFLYQGDASGESEFLQTVGTRLVSVTEGVFLERSEDLLLAYAGSATPATSSSTVLELSWCGTNCWVYARRFEVLERDYLILVALPRFASGDWSPQGGLDVVSDLLVLGLVHHVGRFEPILPGQGRSRELVLAEGLVLGTSAASASLATELRATAATTANVLLSGESGSGRELCARTLHQSSSQPESPFVSISCDGVAPAQLAAEIFGAEIQGRDEPVRREPRLLEAHGGTLFLDSVDQLPIELQGRLVRVLRSGRLEGPGIGESHEARFRLLSSTASVLDGRVAEGGFRVDLAYRLSETVIQVPSLRERIEDIPLVLQSAINRFSHETGRRVRGITVQALQALSQYHYPGNLRELENIVRRMVLGARDGEPLDAALLSQEVRNPRLAPARRTDRRSDLDLARLVAACETEAIREALKRTEGNKSQAAKLLGVSRNGLTKKMVRLGLGD